MNLTEIEDAMPDALAPVLLAAMQRLGQLGRDGAVALAHVLDDSDVDFDEAAGWIAEVATGGLRE
jgi:hypothetical protein